MKTFKQFVEHHQTDANGKVIEHGDGTPSSVEEAKKKGLDGKECWDGYKLAGTKKKGGKTVDNCVKVSEHHQKDSDGNTIPHEEIEEAKKAKKNADRKDRGDQEEFERAQAYLKKHPNFPKLSEAATTRIPAQNGNVYELMYSWRGKTYFCKMFFPQPNKPSKKEVQTALNQVYPSAILRNCVISAVNYGDPYIHVGQGDGFTGNATGY